MVTPTVRAAVALVVAATIIFVVGVIGALVAAGLRLTTGHHQAAGGAPWAVGSAANIAVIGLAIGLGALVLVLPGMAAGRAARLLRRPVLRLRRHPAHDPGLVIIAAPAMAAQPPPQPAADPQPQFTVGPVAGQDGQPDPFPAST